MSGNGGLTGGVERTDGQRDVGKLRILLGLEITAFVRLVRSRFHNTEPFL